MLKLMGKENILICISGRMSILEHVGNRYPETDWLLKTGLTVFMLDVNRGVQ